MKYKGLITALLLLPQLASAQWFSLGEVGSYWCMLEEGVGYHATNEYGGTPASGYSYDIYRTVNDWNNSSYLMGEANNNGIYGCCTNEGLAFWDADHGFRVQNVGGYQSFFYTENGGESWEDYGSSISYFSREIILNSENSGYVFGIGEGATKPQIRKIQDGSVTELYTWDGGEINFGKSLAVHGETLFVTIDFYAPEYSELWRSVDGGITWSMVKKFEETVASGIVIPKENVLYVTTYNGLFHKSLDNGQTWEEITPTGIGQIYDLSFINEKLGYLASDEGKLYRTTDAGTSWFEESTGSVGYIREVVMVNASNVYAQNDVNILYKNALVLDTPEHHANAVVQLQPNPTSGMVTLTGIDDDATRIKLYTMSGKLCKESTGHQLDMSDLSRGIYMITIRWEDGRVEHHKIVKE